MCRPGEIAGSGPAQGSASENMQVRSWRPVQLLTRSQNRDTKRCGTKTHSANRCVGSESRTLGILDIRVPLDITVVFLEITNSLALWKLGISVIHSNAKDSDDSKG